MDRIDSAGCICFRSGKVLLIRYFNRYSFPKGHIEEGETREDAALRETEEETGIKASIISRPLVVPSQRPGDERKVYFFPSVYVSGDARAQDGETDEAVWVEIENAHSILSFDCDRMALEKAVELLRNSPGQC